MNLISDQISDEARAELLEAWEDWDAAPGAVTTTKRLEDACRVVARELGVTVGVLRDHMTAHRRILAASTKTRPRSESLNVAVGQLVGGGGSGG